MPNAFQSRRRFCSELTALAVAPFCVTRVAAATISRRENSRQITLGIGNYGMPSLKLEEAVALIARTGFDSLELSLMPDWDSAPAKLSPERRTSLRKQIADSGLRLTSLMEDLHPSTDDAVHRQGLDRLQQAADLGHELSPDRPPLIQTVLGGGVWAEQRGLFVNRLVDWRDLAETHKTLIAVKPHRSGAMSQPAEAVWLLRELGDSDWLGMVYDYSHYAERDLSIDDTIAEAATRTAHVAVKDVRRNGSEFEFALPGEAGAVDFVRILKGFHEAGYSGDVCCEVSSQVFRRSGYDPIEATKICYRNMAKSFATAGLERHRKS